MAMNRAFYGTKQDGTPIHAFTLANARGMTATVLDMGGTITAIHPDAQSPNMVLGLKDAAAYEAGGWWNCLIGRYANRIRGGFTLDGKHYPLAQDAFGVTLHGGRGQSWGTRILETIFADDASSAETTSRMRVPQLWPRPPCKVTPNSFCASGYCFPSSVKPPRMRLA